VRREFNNYLRLFLFYKLWKPLSFNSRLARITELKCDIITLITLKKLGSDPLILIAALKKLIEEREKARLETSTELAGL
jgi:hypothetical protein